MNRQIKVALRVEAHWPITKKSLVQEGQYEERNLLEDGEHLSTPGVL